MSALKLIPEPTFTAPVSIPRPGDEPAVVRFTFRHRTRKETEAFIEKARKDMLDALDSAKRAKAATDLDNVMSVITGWDLTDEFSRENVGVLLQGYHASAQAIIEAYLRELSGNRIKN